MSKGKCKKVRKQIFDKYNGRCAYCGVKLKEESFTIDHIVPVYRKCNESSLKFYGNPEIGTHDIDNLNPCCHGCNSSKRTFSLERWRSIIQNKFDMAMKESSNLRLLMRFGMIEYNPDFKFYFERL